MVDELTQPAGASAVGHEGQTRQVPQVRFVEFFGKWAAQLKGALGQQIAEVANGMGIQAPWQGEAAPVVRELANA